MSMQEFKRDYESQRRAMQENLQDVQHAANRQEAEAAATRLVDYWNNMCETASQIRRLFNNPFQEHESYSNSMRDQIVAIAKKYVPSRSVSY